MNKQSFRKGLVLLTTALFLVGGFFVTNTAQAAGPTCAVPGDYATIQAAVNDVGCTTINVAAGEYNESLNITNPVILQSVGGRDVTTIKSLTIATSNVTINGFTIEGVNASNVARTNIFLNSGVSNITISNNKINKIYIGSGNGDNGVGLLTTSNLVLIGDNLNVTGNIFQALDTGSNRAFFINPGINHFTFSGNTITGNFTHAATTQAKIGLVENNTITGAGAIGSRSAGFRAWGYPDPTVWGHTTFSGNTVSGAQRGITADEANNVTITGNTLSGNEIGVWVTANDDLSFDLTTISVHNNNLSGEDISGYGVLNDTESATKVDASSNWWGSANGPQHISNTFNVGSQGSVVSDNVTFAPWLNDGTDTDPATSGFQPAENTSFAPVYANADSSTTETEQYSSIQSAVSGTNLAYIKAKAGTYPENVQIFNKTGLTIQGVGDGTLIDGTGYGIEIDNSDSITIKDLKIVTSGPNLHGIYVDDAGFGGRGASPSNNLIIQNTTISATGGVGTEATGIYGGNATAGAHTGWLITGNRITADGGGIGLEDVTASTVSNNVSTITNGTNILWLTMGFNLSTLVVSGNTVNGSGGSQVSFLTDYPSATGKTITGVTVSGNTFDTWGSRGLRIGSGVSGVVVSQNKFLKVGEALKNENSSTVNAESNYWGEAMPTFATKIVTTDGAGAVNHDPWFVNSGKTIFNTDVTGETVTAPSGTEDLSLSSDTVGQADLPAGVTDVVLDNDSGLDLSAGVEPLGDTPVEIGGETVTMTQQVILQSGDEDTPIVLTNLDLPGFNVSILDGTEVQGPAEWDGIIMPPTDAPSTGSAPAGFSVGGTVISIGSPDGTLVFDKAVTILLAGVTGTVGYKPALLDTWQTITDVCGGTYDAPTVPTWPGECSISNGTDTKIVTYHFTSFGGLNVVSSGGGNGGGSVYYSSDKAITTFTIPNQVGTTVINEVAHTITLTMPYGTDVTVLKPTVAITGASIDPLSATFANFTNPKTYIVTAANSGAQAYIVTVNVASATTPVGQVLGASTGPTVIEGCDNRITGFSVTTGQSCVGNIGTTSIIGKVLGAEKFNFTKLMKNNSKGNEVIELQKFLNNLGHNCGTADGKFGPKTKTCVVKFQIANKLKADGIVGPKVRALLNQ